MVSLQIFSVHGEICLHADSVQNSPESEEVSPLKRAHLRGVTFVPGIKMYEVTLCDCPCYISQ
jgi:hypothetical protein